MKILAIFCAAVALTQAQRFPKDPLDPFKKKDSIIFNQYNVNEKKAFVEFAPADPDEQGVDSDGKLNSTVIVYTVEGFVAEYWGMVASYDANKVWSNNIRRASLIEYDVAKNELKTVSNDLTQGLEDLAYDRVTKILYWTDSINKIIMAMETSSYKHFAKIWTSDVVSPFALALHTTKRKLFFAAYRIQGTRISKTELIKCDLDGSNQQSLLQFPDVIRPRGITIDFSDDKLYWTDINFFLQSVVVASDLDGKRKRQFFAAPNGFLWDIAHYKNVFYITDIVNTTVNEYSIYVREKNGRRGKTLKTRLRPKNIDIYAPNEVSAVEVSNECERANCEHFCVAKVGGYVCKCSPGYTLVSGYKCVTNVLIDDYLLVADLGQKRVFQVPLQTNAILADEIIAMPWDDQTDNRIFAVAVDLKNGDHAWYDMDNKEIVWGDRRIGFESGVSSIVVHCCKDEIFWASDNGIYFWNGESSSYETLYLLSFFSDAEIRQITFDCFREQLYWTEYDSVLKKATVKRSDSKGKNVENVLTNLPVTKGITIDYEQYTLYVMTMLDGMLYSLPLKLLENIPSTSPTFFQYQSTDLGASFGSGTAAIWDIRVKNGMVYLADSRNSAIRRYSIREGPSSMEDYGPKCFFLPVTLDFCDRQYYEKFIEKSCPGYTATTTTTTTTTTPTATKNLETEDTAVAAKPKIKNNCIDLISTTDDINQGLKLFFLCLFSSQ